MSSSESFNRSKMLLAAAGVGAFFAAGAAAGLYFYNSLEEKKKLNLFDQYFSRDSTCLSSSPQSTGSKGSKRNSLGSLGSGYTSEDYMFTALNSEDEEFRDRESEDYMFTALNSEDEEFRDRESEDYIFTALNSEDEQFLHRKSGDESDSSRKLLTSSKGSKRNSLSSHRIGYEKDEETSMHSLQDKTESERKELKLFKEVDILLQGNDQDRSNAFNRLKDHAFNMSNNPNFLWRLANACQVKAAFCEAEKDLAAKKKYVYEGLEHAKKALALDGSNPDVNKWYAVLTGMQAEYVPIKQKIENGYLFQKHILMAIKSKPQDHTLYHLIGRFKFELARISWFERKIASSLFGEIPNINYSDAITDLLLAEKLSPNPWKENRLFLGQCYIGEGKYAKAMEWLDSAKRIISKTKEDMICEKEVNALIEKYQTYRN